MTGAEHESDPERVCRAAIKPNSGTLPLAVRDSGSEQRASKLEDAGVKQLKQKSNLGFSKATSTFIMPRGSQHNVHAYFVSCYLGLGLGVPVETLSAFACSSNSGSLAQFSTGTVG